MCALKYSINLLMLVEFALPGLPPGYPTANATMRTLVNGKEVTVSVNGTAYYYSSVYGCSDITADHMCAANLTANTDGLLPGSEVEADRWWLYLGHTCAHTHTPTPHTHLHTLTRPRRCWAFCLF